MTCCRCHSRFGHPDNADISRNGPRQKAGTLPGPTTGNEWRRAKKIRQHYLNIIKYDGDRDGGDGGDDGGGNGNGNGNGDGDGDGGDDGEMVMVMVMVRW